MVDFLRGILAGRFKIFNMFYKLRRAFNAVGEWVLNAFAAIMRVCFPQLCCKYFTKKGRRSAEKFIPSLEAQKRAFNHLATAEISGHVWSKEFRLWLLSMKEYLLIDYCASQEELAEVLFKPCSTEIRTIAVRRCTPNHATILKFVNETKNFNEVVALAKAVPSAFGSLEAKEILKDGSDARRDLMWVMVDKYPHLAESYLGYIFSDEALRLRMDTSVISALVVRAIKEDSNLAPYLELLRLHYHLNSYIKVRGRALDYKKNAVELATRGFELTKDCLNAMDVYDLNTTSIQGKLEAPYDAQAWLYICYTLLGRERLSERSALCDALLNNLGFIKEHVSVAVYHQLCERLIDNAQSVEQFKELLEYAPKDLFSKTVDTMLSLIACCSDMQSRDNGVAKVGAKLADLFPFGDWSEDQQEKAVRLMADSKVLPLERMNELSEILQKAAFEELEIQSELRTIHCYRDDEMMELIAHKLHSRSEVKLLTHSWSCVANYGYNYMQAFQIDDDTFAAIVKRTEDDNRSSYYNEMVKLIRTHATKWGLSEQNYKDLLQSPYSNLAALLKDNVKKVQSSTAIVLNSPDLDEVPEA